QPDTQPVEETEAAAGKGRRLEDRVEAAGIAIARRLVSARIKEADPRPVPVVVVGELERGHSGADPHAVVPVQLRIVTGERIQRIASGDVIKGLIDIDPAEVPEPRFAQINGVDAMRLKNTDGRRPYEPAVAVVLDVRSVMQHVNAEFLRIPAPEKVLHVQVGNSNLLAAPLEVRIESAVGFLFAAIENRDVVLIAVGCLVAEEPDSKIRVGENEAAEVAAERLRAGPYRQEVEVGREVAQLALIKKLLDREVGIVASRAAPHIRLHDCVFRDALVVVVRDQRNLQPLPDRLECSVSLEEIRRNDERLKDRALLVLSEEMNALRLVRAHAGRRWQRARFEQSVGHARERKERVRASER